MGYLTDLIIFAYVLYGVLHVFFNKPTQQWYIVLLYFIVLKMIFNYSKCTVSYVECKLRNVKKEDGYLYQFLDQFIALRYCPTRCSLILIYTTLFSFYYFCKGGKISL